MLETVKHGVAFVVVVTITQLLCLISMMELIVSSTDVFLRDITFCDFRVLHKSFPLD